MAVLRSPYSPYGVLKAGLSALLIVVALQSSLRAEQEPRCPRLVALSPSVTETLYALGLEQRVAAVSHYAKYPPEVINKPKVGSLHDVSLESLIRLNADPVVILAEHRSLSQNLAQLHLPYVTVEHRSITGILDSIQILGTYCEVPNWNSLRSHLQKELDKWKSKFKNTVPVKVMIVIGESGGPGQRQSFYLSGSDGYYAEALDIVGGVNVHQGPTGLMPALSIERVQTLNPEVIIEIAAGKQAESHSEILNSFATMFPTLSAVENNRMHVLHADYTYTPGPRFPLLLEALARLLHPQSFES